MVKKKLHNKKPSLITSSIKTSAKIDNSFLVIAAKRDLLQSSNLHTRASRPSEQFQESIAMSSIRKSTDLKETNPDELRSTKQTHPDHPYKLSNQRYKPKSK